MLFSKMQKGLSMVELLVALAISSFLILGISQIYIDNKRNYLFQQGQAGNQENSRFVLMLLQQHGECFQIRDIQWLSCICGWRDYRCGNCPQGG